MEHVEVVHGAVVRYCGHDASFVADIYRLGDAAFVVAGPPIGGDFERLLTRPAASGSTHWLVDFPVLAYWNPRRGTFFVPSDQVREVV